MDMGMDMGGMDMGGMDMGGMDMATTAMTTAMNMKTTAMTMVMDIKSTATSAVATSTSMIMGDMNHPGMGMGSGSMSMSNPSATPMAMKMECTMSMLWNWYTNDVCFIAKSWKTSTKGIFAGTCIGVFGLLLAINWWRRILSQYKIYCAELRNEEVKEFITAGGIVTKKQASHTQVTPFFKTLRHEWFWRLDKNLCVEVDDKVYIYPSLFEHLLYCVGDTMEWSVHHCVMLLFMYFNGYVFISCMIGAGVGFMLFQNKPLNRASGGEKVSKRCCM